MNDIADLTQAPVLYVLKDKTYEVSPLTQSDFGAIARYAQYLPYTSLQQMEAGNDELKKSLLLECSRKTVRFNSTEFLESMDTPGGSVEVAYHALRHKQPDITREVIGGWTMNHITNIMSLAVLLSDILPEDHVKKNLLPLVKRLRAAKLLT